MSQEPLVEVLERAAAGGRQAEGTAVGLTDPAAAIRTAKLLLGMDRDTFRRLEELRGLPADINGLTLRSAQAVLNRLVELQPYMWAMVVRAREQWAAAPVGVAREALVGGLAMMLMSQEARRPSPVRVPMVAPAADEVFFQMYFRLKEQLGLATQQQVVQRTGVSPATINAIEQRKGRPQYRTVEKIAKAFGVSAEHMLTGG